MAVREIALILRGALRDTEAKTGVSIEGGAFREPPTRLRDFVKKFETVKPAMRVL